MGWSKLTRIWSRLTRIWSRLTSVPKDFARIFRPRGRHAHCPVPYADRRTANHRRARVCSASRFTPPRRLIMLKVSLLLLAAVVIGCSSPDSLPAPEGGVPRPLSVCSADQAKADRCASDRNGSVPVCYDDGLPGPIPAAPDGAHPWPASGCAAPKENNVYKATGQWAWWCCVPASLTDGG